MPYDPGSYTDSDLDPLGYSSRSDGHSGNSRSRIRSVRHRASRVDDGTLVRPGQAARRDKLSDSADPVEYYSGDAQSELDLTEENDGNEVDLIQESADWEPAVDLTPRATPLQRRPHNGFNPITNTHTTSRATAQVAVVLNATPQKEAYKIFNSDELDNGDELQEELDPIVTSDLIPKPRQKKIPSVLPFENDPKRKISETVPSLSSPPKKRGRPLGWRPGDGSYSTKTPGRSSTTTKVKKPTGELKRRGRPPRNPSPTPRQIYIRSNPRFNYFYCEWEGCPAKLHNLNTLRRHLLIVHGNSHSRRKLPQTPPITCKWAKCASKDPPRTYHTIEDFTEHLDNTHLFKQALHMGDGPQNNSPYFPPTSPVPRSQPSQQAVPSAPVPVPVPGPSPPPRYLFNAMGTIQVTPSVQDQEPENDKDKKDRLVRLERVKRRQARNAPDEPTYTAAQLQDLARAMKTKMHLKSEYHEYYERVVGRPKQLERMRAKGKLKEEVGVGDGQFGGGGGGDNAGTAEMMKGACGYEMTSIGPVYGPEWKGLMMG